jgi:hypothetical protein
MNFLFFILPVLMYWTNWIRGSRTEWFFGVDTQLKNKFLNELLIQKLKIHKIFPNGAPIAAIIMLPVFMIGLVNPLAGLLVMLAWLAGEAPGWAHWIRTNNQWFDESYQEEYNRKWLNDDGGNWGLRQLVNKFFDESKDFTKHAIAALVIRGMIWYAPVYAVLVAYGFVNVFVAILATVAMGILFPLTFYLGRGTKAGSGTEEKWYGAAQGVVLALTLGL